MRRPQRQHRPRTVTEPRRYTAPEGSSRIRRYNVARDIPKSLAT
jgi:hypothetical protein